MTDSYQAIYDAVRSKIGRVDAGEVMRAIESAFDISHIKPHLQQEIYSVSNEMQRPSVLFRPVVQPDGNQWCALYGTNLHDGVGGFGDTPEAAMRDFDKNWRGNK